MSRIDTSPESPVKATIELAEIKAINNTGDAEAFLALKGLSASTRSAARAQLAALRRVEALVGNRPGLAEIQADEKLMARPGVRELVVRLVRECS